MSFWLGSSAPCSNPSLAWSMGNGGKGRILIKFPLPLDNGWYKEQPCTAFRCFQHRKERGGFTHEFIVLELLDGSICRIERMGDPDARFDALSPRGSVAHDIAQCFRPDELDQACLDSSEIIAKVELPYEYDLIDVLKICRAIHEGEETRNYTLQVFNCYFFSLAIQVCLTRLVADWEDQESSERWIFQINKEIAALPNMSLNSPLRDRSVIFRVYCALFPGNGNHDSENRLLEDIKTWLHFWITWGIKRDVEYRINNTLWHSTIDSGLNQLVEDKMKKVVVNFLGFRSLSGLFTLNDLKKTSALIDLKLKLMLDLIKLLDTVDMPRDSTLNPGCRPLRSKKINGANTHHQALPELSFNESQPEATRNSQDFLVDWKWIARQLWAWLLQITVIMCGVNLFAPRKDSVMCSMLDEQLESMTKELEHPKMAEHLKLERFSKQLNALSKKKPAIWSRNSNPWIDICHCIAPRLSVNSWTAASKENEIYEPNLYISFCSEAREVEGAWLGSAETIQSELIETLSRVWQSIRDDPPVDLSGPGYCGRFFFTNGAGETTLILPERLSSSEEVKVFISDALSSGEIDKGVRHVKCSLCKNKRAARIWEIKPSNLERHICTHFGIKGYKCIVPDCSMQFTTKDQWKKHIEKKHPALAGPSTKEKHPGGRGRNEQAHG
ncbi:unnamed protein product [Rhizoctonia solani]|uniref:C2H2-type domain-containing protein n=1 Tax=Rhizoctonia solani TaxID=456999 RepID=A0A8H3E275_9AGAM|nr:unnamed protein product [Rhizoctonia solani]